MDECCKKIALKMKEEILNNYKVEESKEGHVEAEVCLWSGDEWRKTKGQQRTKIMKDMFKKFTSKGRTEANSSWWVSEVAGRRLGESMHGFMRDWKTPCRNGTTGRGEEKGEIKKWEEIDQRKVG